jgi:decaprenyl-phosphate phosphoribosyltransferase
MLPLLRLFRPGQWLKNAFVFMPLIFSQHLFDKEYILLSVIAFFAFSFSSSCIYVINDIVDIEADRLHPTKSKRPIASGEISVSLSFGAAIFLLAVSLFLGFSLSKLFAGILLFYIAMQLLYSFKLKQVVIVDVFIIAIGFMLRVFSGAVAIDVVISHWLIITTMFLSLFLAVSKRRSELVMIQNLKIETKRKVLTDYDITFLNLALVIAATGMALSYSLYTMSERTIAMFGTDYLIYTTIFVLFGILRYLFLVVSKDEGENPISILIKDVLTTVNFILWIVACVVIIYFL